MCQLQAATLLTSKQPKAEDNNVLLLHAHATILSCTMIREEILGAHQGQHFEACQLLSTICRCE